MKQLAGLHEGRGPGPSDCRVTVRFCSWQSVVVFLGDNPADLTM